MRYSKIAMAFIMLSFSAVQAEASDDVTIETFDGRALGVTNLSVNSLFGFDTYVSGGDIAGGFAHSGVQFYEGTSIELVTEDEDQFCWPGVGAWVWGTAPIKLQAYEFNSVTMTDDALDPVWFWGGGDYSYLSIGSLEDRRFITRVVFSSGSEFRLDDLTLGIEGVAPGIPEPASWLMLVGGLAIVGGAMRTRREGMRYAADGLW